MPFELFTDDFVGRLFVTAVTLNISGGTVGSTTIHGDTELGVTRMDLIAKGGNHVILTDWTFEFIHVGRLSHKSILSIKK